MKIYVVEEEGKEGYRVFGYYATRELARIRLNLIYDGEYLFWSHTNVVPELTQVNEDLLRYMVDDKIYCSYRVREVEVISKMEDIRGSY